MHFIYYTITFENYGLALILFTLLTRLLMLPLTIKQYQGTAKMQKLNPRLDELRRQYGTDKKRLQEETVKLYQEEKVNPAGGCLPLLIQFPILFSLYPVITRPLRYMLGKTVEQVSAIQELFNTITGNTRAFVQEMEVINYFKNNPTSMSQAESANLLSHTDLINMNFFGLDLSRTPTYSPGVLFGEQMAIYLPLLLIPLIGVVSTYISGRISMASSAAQASQNQQASSMNKSMQVIGPVMTLIFSFQLPAGVLVYWIAGYMIQIVQQLFINKYILKLDNIFTGKSNNDKNPQQLTNGGRRAIKSLPGGVAGGAIGGAAATGGMATGGTATGGTATGGTVVVGGAGTGGAATSGTAASGAKSGAAGTIYGSTADGTQKDNFANRYSSGVDSRLDKNSAGPMHISEGRSLYGGEQGMDNGDLYDGGAMINRVISSLDIAGATGGGAVKAAGSDGIVHGGVFETKHRIPGITNAEDFSGWDGSNVGIGVGGGVGTGVGEGIGEDIGSDASDDQRSTEQRPRGADMRSSTRKNYGSQKRKKKK